MRRRDILWLAILLSLCVASVGLLPVGVGPYTAVYGPASALRAQRAVQLLVLTISLISMVFVLMAAFGSTERGWIAAHVPSRHTTPAATLCANLRC